MRIILCFCLMLTMSACSPKTINVSDSDKGMLISRIYDRDYYTVWDAMLVYLKSKYVVKSADENTGVIRISFTNSTPSSLIDCGVVENSGKLATDNQYFYSYKGTDSPVYTVFVQKGIGYQSVRTISLEGESAVHVEVLTRDTTRVNIHTQYSLTEQYKYHTSVKKGTKMVPIKKIQTDTMHFSTNGPGRFEREDSMICVASDIIEKNILEDFPSKLPPKPSK